MGGCVCVCVWVWVCGWLPFGFGLKYRPTKRGSTILRNTDAVDERTPATPKKPVSHSLVCGSAKGFVHPSMLLLGSYPPKGAGPVPWGPARSQAMAMLGMAFGVVPPVLGSSTRSVSRVAP